VSNWTQLQNAILKVKPGTPVALTVERDGHAVTLHTALAEVPGHGSYFGIAPTVTLQRQGPVDAVKYVGTGFSQVVTGTASALGQVPAALPNLFSANRSQTAAGNLSSVVGAAQATGAAVAAKVGWEYKVNFVLLLIAELNIFWGVFNLVPLLPLDGGHIAGALWEAVKRGFARLTHRPDPGYVDVAKALPLTYAMAAVFMVMGALLIYADVFNPIHLSG
jgi:membrane-associated protease RseP (regulator of RpoE activity)